MAVPSQVLSEVVSMLGITPRERSEHHKHYFTVETSTGAGLGVLGNAVIQLCAMQRMPLLASGDGGPYYRPYRTNWGLPSRKLKNWERLNICSIPSEPRSASFMYSMPLPLGVAGSLFSASRGSPSARSGSSQVLEKVSGVP